MVFIHDGVELKKLILVLCCLSQIPSKLCCYGLYSWRCRTEEAYLFFYSYKYEIHCWFNRVFVSSTVLWGRRSRDRMVVGFLTTYAICAHHHYCCEFEPRSRRGELETTLCDKFVRHLRRSVVFSWYSGFHHQ
jgi:hypothetical protein